jgi:hypothetical protein
MTPEKLKRFADISTIVSAITTAIGVIVAVITIVAGSCQFQKGQESEHESKAVELFIKYEELMKERANSTKPANAEENQVRENLAIAIAESIFRLETGDRGWEDTVRWMVSAHAEYLKNTGLYCKTFDPRFIKLVNKELDQNVCRDKQNR